jgi:hypothetical protein
MATPRRSKKTNESEDSDEYSPLATGEDREPNRWPQFSTISGAHFYARLPMPRVPSASEFALVPLGLPTSAGVLHAKQAAMLGFLASWNLAWESAQFRPEALRQGAFLGNESLPRELRWLAKLDDVNLTLIPIKGPTRLAAYAPLYHLLPRHLLESAGLPLIKTGSTWPPVLFDPLRALPADAEQRLSQAFARHVWPLLAPQSPLSAFRSDEPLRLLAHDLDFWLPPAVRVIEQIWRQFPFVEVDAKTPAPSRHRDGQRKQFNFDDSVPRMGGTLWRGEAEANDVTREVVDAADQDGRLRGLLDAIRSHRVEEDFSDKWSFAREDFERRLHGKRLKLKPKFVELNDSIPVHGPETEIHNNLAWQQFFAVLNSKEREIIVCMRSGKTKLGEVAQELGYANHSPISKALARIRARAERYLR